MQIKEIISKKLQPIVLEVHNESDKHAGHAGSPGTGQSHFSVLVVSDKFKGKNRIERHQMVYACLKDLMNNPIHALAIKAYTQEEFNLSRQEG